MYVNGNEAAKISFDESTKEEIKFDLSAYVQEHRNDIF